MSNYPGLLTSRGYRRCKAQCCQRIASLEDRSLTARLRLEAKMNLPQIRQRSSRSSNLWQSALLAKPLENSPRYRNHTYSQELSSFFMNNAGDLCFSC
jgi:hypothetical protein